MRSIDFAFSTQENVFQEIFQRAKKSLVRLFWYISENNTDSQHAHAAPRVDYRTGFLLQSPVQVPSLTSGPASLLLMITAGHCVDAIKEIIDTAVDDAVGFRIIDNGASDQFGMGIPVAPTALTPISVVGDIDEIRADFGAIWVARYYAQQILSASDNMPIEHCQIAQPGDHHEAYVMLGFPYESVRQNITHETDAIQIRMLTRAFMLFVTPDANSVPSASNRYRFRASIDSGQDHVRDIDGMSGGPIFGVKFTEDRQGFVLRLVAAQSSWDSNTRIIYANYMHPFIDLLIGAIENKINSDREYFAG